MTAQTPTIDQTAQLTPAAERAAAEDARRAERAEDARRGQRTREDAAARERGDFVGFVGCARRGRLLRVRVAVAFRQTTRVLCPYCNEEHVTPHAMVRPCRAAEPEPELAEIAPPPPDKPDAAPDDPTALRGTQRVSDAAIFDAIPADRDILAADVAQKVGYAARRSSVASLLNRLRRMNARAEKAGDPAPFVITIGTGRKPTLVRQAEPEIQST